VKTPSAENGQGLLAGRFPAGAPRRWHRLRAIRGRRNWSPRKRTEQQIDALKYQKAAMPADQYKKQLGTLLLELAKTQEEIDK
jgi:hypothetical protein